MMKELNYEVLFQFHKGTIKTERSFARDNKGNSFQFHKGTIKTRPAATAIRVVPNFNSIKVRLKPIRTKT